MDGDIGFAGCPRVVPLRTGFASSIEESRADIARVEEWF